MSRYAAIALFVAFATIAPPRSLAEEAWHVQSWRVADGLPDNSVKSITQTSDGVLWLATAGTVVSFDGLDFHPLPAPAEARLTTARVERLAGGRQGELWLATRLGGLFKWSAGLLANLDAPNNESFKIVLDAMCVDAAGGVWVGRRGLIEHYHAGTKDMIRIPSQRVPEPIVYLTANQAGSRVWAACGAYAGWCGQDELPAHEAAKGAAPPVALAAADASRFWISRGDRLELFDGETGLSAPIGTLPDPVGDLTSSVIDGAGGLWIGFVSSGLFHWDGKAFSRMAAAPGGVRTLWRDRDGAVWVGTEGQGLHCIRPRLITRYPLPAQDGPQQAHSVAESSKDALCIVAPGRRVYLSAENPPHLLPVFDSKIGHECRSTAPDADGSLWVGMLGAGIAKYSSDGKTWARMNAGLASLRVRTLFRDDRQRLWAGLDDGVAWWNGAKFESALQGQKLQVMCFANDRHGRLWIGTVSGKVCRLAGTPPRVEEMVQGLPGPMVHALAVTRDNTLWMGLEGAGLYRRDAAGRLGSIKQENGLPGASVLGIVEVRNGLLALGTQRGICLARVNDLAACAEGWAPHVNTAVVGAGEGLADVGCSIGGQPVAWTRRSGRVVFATSGGVLEFDPMQTVAAELPCPLTVQSLETNGICSNAFAGTLESFSTHLPAILRITAPAFVAPQLVRLRYRVEGQDADWRHVFATRALPLGAPPPGRYQVRVQVSNNALDWEEPGLAVTWIVHPRFWQTLWFQTLVVVIAVWIAFLLWRRSVFVRMRVRIAGLEKEQALTDERARIARDMHDAVGARLTQISLLQDMALAEADIPAPAREKLLHASAGTQEALMAMDEIVWSINPHNDTLRELASYLAHTLREYFEPLNISCRLDIADNLPDHTVHAHVRHALLLMVKEGLQNIAKHAHATQVTLQIGMEGTDFCIRIKDDGVGMPAAISTEGGHDGLRNLQERITSLGGSLKLQPGAASGTEITIAIPLNCLS